MRPLRVSWRTSLAGVLVVLSQLAALAPSTPEWLATALRVIGAIAAGAGFLLARDHDAGPTSDLATATKRPVEPADGGPS